ncbi:alkaline phosphatase D family protein [Actinokineospora xionganensis]|uniref:Alkaline phosphatase D family protein n=1 Tax=Actinokineospora xionganensis TaxID=2684470 RepID=A0ABR7KZN5_9PSEU|nr:alkaline phosphatase D family protein [Actinokineospora xionganensis]MBC6445889.1 alkaline phosphatase D family protein [Actinokineospora xionganensis]
MNRRRVREDWLSDFDVTRTHIFVPAIMGAGVLVSLLTLLRDALHGKGGRGRARRIELEARATARHTLTGDPAGDALTAGLRPRAAYLLAALSCGGFAVYVLIGATANYLRRGAYVADIAWLWALSLAVAAALGAVAAVCAVAYSRWPKAARWELTMLAHTPLGQSPAKPRVISVLLLGWAAAFAGATAAIFTFVVAKAPRRLEGLDAWVAATAPKLPGVDLVGPFDPLGPVPLYLLAVAVIGLSAVRCSAVPVVYVVAAASGLLLDVALDLLVPRDRPIGATGDSFPSGQEIQGVLLIGFAPLALLVLTRRTRVAWVGAGLLALSAGVAGLSALRAGTHWWSDSASGVLWGVAAVLACWWALAHPRLHRHCTDCPLAASPHPGEVGLIHVGPRVQRVIRLASRVWAPAAIIGFLALAGFVGLPSNPEADTLGPQIADPAQLVLLALATVGWLLALKSEAAGAVVLALAGGVLGTLAALAYHPLVSLAVAVVFLAPAAGFWLVWQHGRTIRAITVLAVSSVLLLSGTWVGALTVYDTYYGPAHPASSVPALPADRVLWSWAGGVTTGGATVVAELAAGSRQARLRMEPVSGVEPIIISPQADVGADGVARLVVDGLAPGTAYRYRIEVDGVVDRSRGVGELRTAGATSLTVAFGGCARTGSNGAVFDAIRALRPDLYIATGDLHYGNPDTPDVGRFAGFYRRTLTAPAQAALYRSVPIAYVWDDHDYGPNDADASAPTRAAARAAYDRYVPHYPLASGPGEAINQAFTLGRVRFVLTDTRSERTAATMLGERQLAWLRQELVTASHTHAVVVWVNPDPWIAPADPTGDDWGGYAQERRVVADTIAEAGIRNLVMVSGDAHMVAIDDGTNTDYSTSGYPGFPLLHAAALDRPGGVKGGPYSEGAFPGAGQFGTLTVTDAGASVAVTLTGRDWRGEVLAEHRFTVPAR